MSTGKASVPDSVQRFKALNETISGEGGASKRRRLVGVEGDSPTDVFAQELADFAACREHLLTDMESVYKATEEQLDALKGAVLGDLQEVLEAKATMVTSRLLEMEATLERMKTTDGKLRLSSELASQLPQSSFEHVLQAEHPAASPLEPEPPFGGSDVVEEDGSNATGSSVSS